MSSDNPTDGVIEAALLGMAMAEGRGRQQAEATRASIMGRLEEVKQEIVLERAKQGAAIQLVNAMIDEIAAVERGDTTERRLSHPVNAKARMELFVEETAERVRRLSEGKIELDVDSADSLKENAPGPETTVRKPLMDMAPVFERLGLEKTTSPSVNKMKRNRFRPK